LLGNRTLFGNDSCDNSEITVFVSKRSEAIAQLYINRIFAFNAYDLKYNDQENIIEQSCTIERSFLVFVTSARDHCLRKDVCTSKTTRINSTSYCFAYTYTHHVVYFSLVAFIACTHCSDTTETSLIEHQPACQAKFL